jgi:hypothetical protein
MRALLTLDRVAAVETFLCGTCFYGPYGLVNQGYAREQAALTNDVDPDSPFEDCTGDNAAPCCICGIYEVTE